MKKILTLLSCICLFVSINASAQCVLTATANPTACDPGTNLYDVLGTIMYVSPPTTGTLEIVGSCGGSQSISPPFPSSIPYALTGLTSNGASCNVFIYFSALPTCFYSATYTAPAACMATSVEESTFLSNLNISPNPSNGSINLSFDQSQMQTTSIEIVDVLGRTVYTENLQKFTGSYSKKLDLTGFNKGIYFVRITSESGSETRKIIYY